MLSTSSADGGAATGLQLVPRGESVHLSPHMEEPGVQTVAHGVCSPSPVPADGRGWCRGGVGLSLGSPEPELQVIERVC